MNSRGLPANVSQSMQYTPVSATPAQKAQAAATRSGSLERQTKGQRPTVKQQMYSPGIMATSPDLQQPQPQGETHAQEIMKSYLIGEGIKKAQLRALHARQPVKKKKGFLRSLFS